MLLSTKTRSDIDTVETCGSVGGPLGGRCPGGGQHGDDHNSVVVTSVKWLVLVLRLMCR